MPKMLPLIDAANAMKGRICQPNQAPKIARSLKSPCPIPSILRMDLKIKAIIHNDKYPAIAPIMAFSGVVKTLKQFNKSPIQISGKVISSGKTKCSSSIKTSAINPQVNSSKPKVFKVKPKLYAI